MTADRTLVLDGNTTGLVESLDNARDALARVKRPSDEAAESVAKAGKAAKKAGDDIKLGKPLREAAAGAEKVAKAAKVATPAVADLGKAGSVLGGTIGGLLGNLDDLGDLMDQSWSATQKLAVGLGVATAALAGVGSIALDVVVNLDDYAATIGALSSMDLITQRQIAQLEQAHSATTALGGAFDALALSIGIAAAPAIERASVGLIRLQAGGAAVAAFYSALPQGLEAAQQAGRAAAQAIHESARAAYEKEKADRAAVEWSRQFTVYEKQAEEAERARTASAEEASRKRRAALDEERATTAAWMESWAAFEQEAMGAQLAAAAAASTRNGGWSSTITGPEVVPVTVEEIADPWIDAFGRIGGAASSMFGTMGDLISTFLAGNARSSKQAARQQYAIAKAVALSQAALAIPLAVLSNLTAGPVGIATAAIAGTAAAAQAAIIAATPMPQFHRGGVADEAPAMLRTNEAVLTPTGREALGLRTSSDVDRANAGQAPAGSGGVNVSLMIDGVALRHAVREVARGARPGYGQRGGR